jgi:hypothetical protein
MLCVCDLWFSRNGKRNELTLRNFSSVQYYGILRCDSLLSGASRTSFDWTHCFHSHCKRIWRWRVPPTHWYTFIKLHGVTSWKTFIYTRLWQNLKSYITSLVRLTKFFFFHVWCDSLLLKCYYGVASVGAAVYIGYTCDYNNKGEKHWISTTMSDRCSLYSGWIIQSTPLFARKYIQLSFLVLHCVWYLLGHKCRLTISV